MSRSPIPLTLALFAVALVAVPAALANGRDHRAVRIQGVCTQQSTSKLKLSREDRRIEVAMHSLPTSRASPARCLSSRRPCSTSPPSTTRPAFAAGASIARRSSSGAIGPTST